MLYAEAGLDDIDDRAIKSVRGLREYERTRSFDPVKKIETGEGEV